MLSEVMLQFAVALCISNSAIIYIAQDFATGPTRRHGTVTIERESALELQCRNIVNTAFPIWNRRSFLGEAAHCQYQRALMICQLLESFDRGRRAEPWQPAGFVLLRIDQ